MIVEIGLIVGCYVFTRMCEVLAKPAAERHVVVMVAALITLSISAILSFSLFMRGFVNVG
jgi:hypothetical protein